MKHFTLSRLLLLLAFCKINEAKRDTLDNSHQTKKKNDALGNLNIEKKELLQQSQRKTDTERDFKAVSLQTTKTFHQEYSEAKQGNGFHTTKANDKQVKRRVQTMITLIIITILAFIADLFGLVFTEAPTAKPSSKPSISAAPSRSPTSRPSSRPSTKPSSTPSRRPR